MKHLKLKLCAVFVALFPLSVVSTAAQDDACAPGVTYSAQLDGDTEWTVAYSESISTDVASVEAYWNQTYPELYGEAYPGLCATIEYVAMNVPFADTCGLTEEIASGNAFYCIPANVVMWDGPGFFHPIYDTFGDAANTYIIAHEYGHAAQFLSGNIPPGPRTVNIELQADCLAGSYLDYSVAQGELTEDEAGEVLSIAIAVGQPRVGVSWTEKSHGTSAQRIAALNRGFEGGASACLEPIQSPPTDLPQPDDVLDRLSDAIQNGERPRPRR